MSTKYEIRGRKRKGIYAMFCMSEGCKVRYPYKKYFLRHGPLSKRVRSLTTPSAARNTIDSERARCNRHGGYPRKGVGIAPAS